MCLFVWFFIIFIMTLELSLGFCSSFCMRPSWWDNPTVHKQWELRLPTAAPKILQFHLSDSLWQRLAVAGCFHMLAPHKRCPPEGNFFCKEAAKQLQLISNFLLSQKQYQFQMCVLVQLLDWKRYHSFQKRGNLLEEKEINFHFV